MQKLNFKPLTYCILGGGCKLIKTTKIKELQTTKIGLVKTKLLSL